MITTLFSLASTTLHAIGAIFLVIFIPIISFFGYAQPTRIATSTPEVSVEIATSSPLAPVPALVSPPVHKKAVTVPIVVPQPVPRIIPPPPVEATTTLSTAVGTTTLAIASVPLLTGGTAHAGQSVPISYLQITNVGGEGALLKGFWVEQNGSSPTESVIGLSTVDDRGGSRSSAGGAEGSTPFQNGVALAPTDAYFAPGQMRLFTIKATITRVVDSYIGMQLVIDVTSIETAAAVQGQFPIRGTTWTIAQ